MTKIIRKLTKTAMLAVAFMFCATSAWAATVTTDGNAGDSVVIKNTSANAGGYSWNATDFTLTIPEKSNLPLGALVRVTSIEMATLAPATTTDGMSYDIPTAIAVGGISASLNAEATYDSSLFGAAGNALKIAKYAFAANSGPILTVGMPNAVKCILADGKNGIRALPTNSNGDTDLVVAVPNYNAQYVPCIRITGIIVSTTVYTASPTTTTANFSNLEWTPSIDDVDISEATLVIDGSSLSTLTVDQTLSFGTLVVKNAASPLTLTQSGDNAISIKNLKVASGVQLKLSGSAPLSVSNGGVTGGSEIYVSSGTTLTLTNAGCPAKFNVYGTLETAGDYSTLLINADNRFQASSHLKITSGTASVASPNGGNNGISGHVTIASNAKLVPLKDDGLSYNKSDVVLDISGTLAFYFGRRWTIGSADNHTINLYDGAIITQSGTENNMDFNKGSGKINALGNAEISGTVNLRSNSVTFNVAASKTLTLSKAPINPGSIEKTGDGVLSCTVDTAAPITITGGQVVSSVFPTANVSIGEDCTFTLKNVAWTSSPERFSGAGTLELFNDRAYVGNTQQHCTHTVTGVTFGGTLKFTATNNTTYGCGHVISNVGFLSSDTRPQLELDTLSSGSYSKLFFNKSYNNQTVNIRDLKGSGDLSAKASGGTAQNQTLDNKQTENTEFSGRLITDDSGSEAEHKTNLIVYGDGSGEVKTLTLSGANTSVGQLSVSSDARVLFSSTGSWAAGTVTVANGGYLEVNNPSAVASTLDLQSGGTIVIKTVTTTTTTGEGDEDVEETTTSVVPIAAGTVTFPDSGEAVIDVSAIPDLATDAEVTIITASTSLDDGIANLRLIGKPYSLKVVGSALKVVNDGGLVWTSAKGWGGKDVTKYGEATIKSPGTVALDGTSLSFDTLTLAGSGTVSFSRTGDETITVNNIVIGSDVTLGASAALDLTGATITGDGTLNIPAGTTYSMDGVNCSAKITCAGTLETSGATTLSSTATTISGTIDVLSGTTTLATAKCGITGTVTIEPEAWLSSPTWDALDYNGTTTLNVYGTINLQDVWSFASGNTLNFYNGCTITDAGNSHIASYDLIGGPIYVKPGKEGATGTVDLSAVSRLRANTVVNVTEGMTFTVSGQLNSANDGTGFGFTKQGSGIFNLTPSSMSTFTGTTTVSAGQMVMTSFPTFTTVSIADGATFTLKNASWTGPADIFSGNGTLELYANTSDFSQYASTSSFAGKLKVIGNNSKIPYFNGTAPQFTAKPDFELDGNMTLTDAFCGNSKKFTVKNLTCTTSGRIDPYYTNTADARYVSTLQTRDTVCAAVFVSNSAAAERKTGLYVYGQDATVHSLTLTGANTTRGPLEVDTYGKVVFSSTGYWYGPVTIGNNGYLQSDSAATTVAGTLTLQDGATIVRGSQPVKATALTALDANATIKIAFADDVTPTNGMVVLSGTWGTTPNAARFAFADSTLVGEWILTTSADGLSIAAAAAKVTPTTGNPVPYASVELALNDYAMLLNTDEGATMTILNGTTLTELEVIQLAAANIYYDRTSGVLTKAVAKVGQTCYPSLSAAISDGAAVTLLRDSSEAITLDVAITLTETAAYSGTLSGSGTLTLSALRSSALTFGTWTGTVVLPRLDSIAGDTFSFNSYGIEGSTVRVSDIDGGWLKDEEVNPTIDIPEGVTLTISDFSASFNNTFKALSGAGTFAVTYNTAIDTTSGSWYSDYSAYFLVKNVSNFTGSLSTGTPGIAIGSAKPQYQTAGGKIRLETSATIATKKTWTATGGIELANSDATLTNTDGELVPAPTTNVSRSRVVSSTSAGTTTYSVEVIPGTIFSVW